MHKAYVLRVFTDFNGEFGDKTTVIIDEGKHIPYDERKVLTKQLNTVETAFVNDLVSANISIMHTQGEVDFAGTPALGAAWLLSMLNGKPIKGMSSRSGDIVVSQNGDLIWMRAKLAAMPPWHHKQLKSAEAVERIKLEDTKTWEHTMVWAWADEAKGLIRARTFASDWNIPEAQSNGSGSMMLAVMVNKAIEVKHGEGSVIFAKPAPHNYADIGGRVVEEPSISV
jgi:predicted PhzF superfamily epimerase YddE/YHI9